jgi:DNA polymerase III delta prime subunit
MKRELIRYNDISHIADHFDPLCVEEIVFPSENISNYLKRWVNRKTATDNLLFYGPSGTGKTRAADTLARTRAKDYLQWNPIRYVECQSALFSKLLDSLEGESMAFQRADHPDFQNIVVLDEVDNYDPTQQGQLKKIMERKADFAFILLTNHIRKLDIGLRNRCTEISWNMAPFESCLFRIRKIANTLGKESITDDVLRNKIYTTDGWRQITRNIDFLNN